MINLDAGLVQSCSESVGSKFHILLLAFLSIMSFIQVNYHGFLPLDDFVHRLRHGTQIQWDELTVFVVQS